MPAIRTNTQPTTPPSSNKSAPGWSKDQKSVLFNHVLKFGEKDWKVAVPGKTGHQCQEQWKKTLLPYIRRVSGL